MKITDEMIEAGLSACPLNYFRQRTNRGEGVGYTRCSVSSDDVRLILEAALAAAPASAPEPFTVPIHKDGNWVFIDGPGDVELDHGGKMRKQIAELRSIIRDNWDGRCWKGVNYQMQARVSAALSTTIDT